LMHMTLCFKTWAKITTHAGDIQTGKQKRLSRHPI
jgi:hypothetical protein